MTPPHFDNQEKLRNTTSGIFGWYAKTENGVVGIIRAIWCFYTEKYQTYYDDAYYIIEYSSDECKSISRDALLELLGIMKQSISIREIIMNTAKIVIPFFLWHKDTTNEGVGPLRIRAHSCGIPTTFCGR